MKRSTWLLLVLAALVFVRAPLAEGTAPDPTWLSGLSDDDLDDVVARIALEAYSVDTTQPDTGCPRPEAISALPPARDRAPSSAPRPSSPTRAPPSA